MREDVERHSHLQTHSGNGFFSNGRRSVKDLLSLRGVIGFVKLLGCL